MSDDSHTPQDASDGLHEIAPTQGQQVATPLLSIDEKLRKAIREHVHFLIFKPEYQAELNRGKYPSDSEDLLVSQLINAMHIYVEKEVERQVKSKVSDLVATDQEATTPPVESARLPKDNQIDDILHKFLGYTNAKIVDKQGLKLTKVALATAIGEATPKEDKRIDDNRYGDAPHEYFVGYNHAVKQFVEALRDIGLEV